MTPKEVLSKVKGLTREQLAYYVRMNFVVPKKKRRGKNEYTSFNENEVLLIEKAFYYIIRFGSKPKFAFEKARTELKQVDMELNRS